MPFMTPEVFTGVYYVVTHTNGESEIHVEEPTDDGDVDIERKSGTIGRLSAPGYMDCTEWEEFDSEVDADNALTEENWDAMSTSERATYARGFLTDRQRPNGEVFYTLKDNAPDWLRDTIREAHGDMLPDDHKYRFIVDALDALSDYDDAEEARERVDSDVDIYTHDLTTWLASSNDRVARLDDVLAEGDVKDGFSLLQRAQYAERSEVFAVMLSLVTEDL